jgi:hypothetical protein
MRLTDLYFNDNLGKVVEGIFGVVPRYEDVDDDRLPDTVKVPWSFPDLPEDQQYVSIKVVVPILNFMRVMKGHYLLAWFNPPTGDLRWAKSGERPAGYVADVKLVSVEQFKELLQTVRSRL